MAYSDLHRDLLLQQLLDEMEAGNTAITVLDGRLTTIEATIPTTGIYYASNYSTFAAAVTAIGSTVSTLVVDSSQTITASLNVATSAPNCTVVIIGSGSFTGESSVTITLGKFEAPRRQVFYGLTVTFSEGFILYGYRCCFLCFFVHKIIH